MADCLDEMLEEIEQSYQPFRESIQRSRTDYESFDFESKFSELKAIGEKCDTLEKEEKQLKNQRDQIAQGITKSKEVLSRHAIEKLEKEVTRLEAKRRKEIQTANAIKEVFDLCGISLERVPSSHSSEYLIVTLFKINPTDPKKKYSIHVEMSESELKIKKTEPAGILNEAEIMSVFGGLGRKHFKDLIVFCRKKLLEIVNVR